MKIKGWMAAAVLVLSSANVWSGELEERLAQARDKLDQAAAELAEAYAQAYADGANSHKHDRAMLGVLLDDCCVKHGVELSGVTPGGGADQAGMEAGDVIVQVGDAKLTGKSNAPLRKLTRFMRDVVPGDVVTVVYRRDGEMLEADIRTQAQGRQTMRLLKEKVSKIGEDLGRVHTRVFAPDPPHAPAALTFVDVHGDLASYFGVDEGVLVLKEPESGPLKAGDILLSVDGEAAEDANSAFRALVRIDEPSTVAVMRKGKRRALTVEPGEISEHDASSVRVIRIDKARD